MKKLFTSESVSEGHPDKCADKISDAILDAFLRQDRNAHVAAETFVTTGQVVVMGEVSSSAYVDIQSVVRDTIKRIGYTKSDYMFDANSCGILTAIHEQSPDINQGVSREEEKMQGAGDQGMMFGYATDETETYMPVEHYLATLIMNVLADIRKEGQIMTYLRPDAKSQVSVEYDNGRPSRIDTIVVSTQHDEFASEKTMQEVIKNDIIETVIPIVKSRINRDDVLKLFNPAITYHINPTGKFVIGGPAGDTGLTGRKIIVDTYGGRGAHGGGAFCVDADTEYLSPEGWKKISEYDGGKVAQWDNYKMTFVDPLVYHKHKAEKMYRISNGHSLDMVLSENHNVVFETSKGNIVKKRVKDLIYGHEIANGNNGFIPVSFDYEGGSGLDMTDDEIRLQVAFCADGYFVEGSSRMNLKRDYKKERIEDLLELSDIKYNKYHYGEGFTRYTFLPPKQSKSLVECFKGANKAQLKVIADELVLWDGDRDKIFRTTHKEDADFAQFVFMSAYGTNSTIISSDRIGELYGDGNKYSRKSVEYIVTRHGFKKANMRRTGVNNKFHFKVEDFTPEDGMMYCFTVPSSMLVLRRNNRVFVTGNSGKDSSKVDRSAAYVARFLAKNLVANGFAKKVQIQLAYAIGVAEPVSIDVNTFGTAINMSDEHIAEFIIQHFDLTPYGIEKMLHLKNPIYEPTAAYGHFGREPYVKDGMQFFPWEVVLSKDDFVNHKKYEDE